MSPASCELWLDAEAETLRSRLPAGTQIAEAKKGATVRLLGDPGEVAKLVAGLGVAFEVRAPEELRDALARLGSLLIASALRGAAPQPPE